MPAKAKPRTPPRTFDKRGLAKALDKYSAYLIVDRGLSALTAECYCRSMSTTLTRLASLKPTHAKIRKHMLWMHRRPYSYHHIINTSIAIEHYTTHKGTPLKLGRPKKPKRLIADVLSEAEVARLIQSAPDLRRRALIALLAYSGLRNAELRALKVEHVNLAANQIKILAGKGHKDRVVNIGVDCARLIADYLDAFPRPGPTYLFTTLLRNAKLHSRDVRKMLLGAAKRAKIGRRVYPHLLRHSLATNLLNRGASLMMIRDQLGHAFIESTMIYTQSMPARVRAEYEFYKPAYL